MHFWELHLVSGNLKWKSNRKPKTLYASTNALCGECPFWENITFGLPWDSNKFEKVIKACALEDDIASFPDGASSEIGERGVTLSGGQNQRVSLARACYAAEDGDVVLCDDVLSALDATVGAAVVFRMFYQMIMACFVILHESWPRMQYGLQKHADSVLTLNQDGKQVSYNENSETDKVAQNLRGRENVSASSSGDVVTILADSDELGVDSEQKKGDSMRKNTKSPTKLINTEESKEGTVGYQTWLKYIDAGVNECGGLLSSCRFAATQALRMVRLVDCSMDRQCVRREQNK